VWFRRDLRVADNPALTWAANTGRPVVPLYILDDDGLDVPGGASRWWLHGSLSVLDQALRSKGSRLIVAQGDPRAVLERLVSETAASALVWNRRYEPRTIAQDRDIMTWGKDAGLEVTSFNAGLLHEPWTIQSGIGSPYRVFTPYLKACLARGHDAPQGAPGGLSSPASWPVSLNIETMGLLLKASDWAQGLRAAWSPGEAEAQARLEAFMEQGLATYAQDRDRPALTGTSGLSPHLHFGEIGPRQVAAAIDLIEPGEGPATFMKELLWREFSHHLLFHNPEMETANLRPAFDAMPWCDAPDDLRRWQRGETGYPLIDAGMRELWTTGWMHNRVRMVVASFLTKHLMIDWRLGADWFLDTLVDADAANNSAGWQWVAGSGADAAPYFRVFNPVAQSRRFDPDGAYLRRWLPELSGLSTKDIHEPWAIPHMALAKAEIALGKDYPQPMIDHGRARQRALDIYARHIQGKR